MEVLGVGLITALLQKKGYVIPGTAVITAFLPLFYFINKADIYCPIIAHYIVFGDIITPGIIFKSDIVQVYRIIFFDDPTPVVIGDICCGKEVASRGICPGLRYYPAFFVLKTH